MWITQNMEQLWSAKFRVSARPMKRYEWWRQSYREDRYGQHLTQPELNRRFRDVLVNLLTLTPDAKFGFPSMGPVGIRWMELMTHVQEEFFLRHGPYPAGYTRDIHRFDPIPAFAGDLAKKAARALVSKGLASNQVFIKYGKPEHMTALYQEGRLRVQPASYYSMPDHTGAIRDDELSLQVSLALSRDSIIKVVKNPQDLPPDTPSQRLDFRFQHDRDFWLYCVSSSTEPRLFVDFDATACVIIKDRQEFSRRLRAASTTAFPGTTDGEGCAIYIDPLRPTTAKIHLPMSKDFRYAYQDEYRFVWETSDRRPLSHVDLALDGLHDIAELVLL
jgi:hypothetical protein